MIRVLIIEDDPMVAQLNQRYIELVEGFEVAAIVRTAAEALDELKDCKVDLALLDVFMPGTTGIDFLMKVREMGKSLDVIMVTAACDNVTITKALRLGAVDYVIKPFEFERLKDALIKYKEMFNVVHEQREIKQQDLDNYLLGREHFAPVQDLPKGIDRNTLKKVWKHIDSIKYKMFSTEELAAEVGISRVSTRKYLEFLKEAGVLKLDIAYGTVGRPVYRYCCANLDTKAVVGFF